MAKDTNFELGAETNVISLVIVGAATLGGMAIGWFSKHYLHRKQLKSEVIEVIKTMTKNEIDKLFSGAEEPKVTIKHKSKETMPVQP